MIVVGCIFLLVIGIVMIRYPEKFYEITESWKSDFDSDASHSYIVETRIAGTIIFIIAVLNIIVHVMNI